LLEIGIDTIHRYNLELAARLATGLADLGADFVTPGVDKLRSSIVTVRFPGHDQARVAQRLNEGGVVVSPRIGAVRFAPHLYNTAADIERALDVLKGVLTES
ncbi:MAG TPA: aminotransferase class V-fold PLP-dependent enzyme, partial [Anaerolineae bacterium]|nr:aminotransferase class V-fold PLP-dependent enzyme [Anaerolineae bacterium]